MGNIKTNETMTGVLSSYDKNHGQYREMLFLRIMDEIERYFVNSFRFEGDKDFTVAKQKTFFKQLFRFGVAGVVNVNKLALEAIGVELSTQLESAGIPMDQILGALDKTHIPVGIAPSIFDVDELVLKGVGFTAARHNTTRKTYNITRKSTAIARYNYNYDSGWYRWFAYAYELATTKTVTKKMVSITDSKLARNRGNNSQNNDKFEDIYDVAKGFLDLSPSQKSIAGNEANEAFELNVGKMLDQKISKISMADETLLDMVAYIKSIGQNWKKMLGKRENVDSKDGDQITAEFKDNEVHWAIMEKDFKDELETFMEEYKNVFGTQLTLVDVAADKIKELEEHEKAMSGRNGEDTTDNKLKGVK